MAAAPLAEMSAFLACLVVGVSLLLNTHPIGDGMWFWYATDLRHGIRLYRDLHLALQPLYVLLTAAFQVVLGTGWLAGKVFPLLQLLVFTGVLVRLARFVPWPGWQRGLLAFAAFLFVLQPGTYRFDDYHVTSDIFTVGSLLLVLQLGSASRSTKSVGAVGLTLGLCCGLAAMTRLNDGAALGIASLLVLLLLYWRHGAIAAGALALGALLAMAGVLLLLGESPANWFHWSIAAAGAIKGGTGNILFSPLLLPWHLLANVLAWKTALGLADAAGLWFAVQQVERRYRRNPHRGWQGVAALWTAALAIGLFPLVHHTQTAVPLELLVRCATLALLVACLGVAGVAVLRRVRGEALLLRPACVLLLFPLMHLLGGALTAAHTLPDPYLSLAMLMLIAPLLVPGAASRNWALPLLANLAMFMAVIVAGKVRHPYFWWTYDDGPVYRDRVWYRHPQLGPMYIERQQLAVMRQLCNRVQASGPGVDLLSMPFPYANYFCQVPPWQSFVQTWYDTTSAATIHTLVGALGSAPPRWIAYEYDPFAIQAHEATYYRGQPMAHRALRDLVVQRVLSGTWTVRQHACSRTSEWLLLETVRAPDGPDPLRAGFQPEGGLCR